MLPVLLAQVESATESAIDNLDFSGVTDQAASAAAAGAGTAILGGLMVLWIILGIIGYFSLSGGLFCSLTLPKGISHKKQPTWY